jgi:hypothetical protein
LNYKRALAIDPTTKSAKHYYKKLKAKVAAESKRKHKLKPKPHVSDMNAPGN